MDETTHPYRPDYAVSPGEILAERLSLRGMSPAELARRSGLTPRRIHRIMAGQTPIEPDDARKLEQELGLDARVWLNLDRNHRRKELQ